MSTNRDSRIPVIVGIGMTAFTAASHVSELELATEAITSALTDAGLTLGDVGGLVTFDMDSNDPLTVSSALSLGDLSWFSITPYGGGLPCAAVQDAALAVEHGLADVVVVYRAANMRSEYRFGQGENTPNMIFPGGRWTAPYGLITPAQLSSLWFMRYFLAHGLSNEDLAPVALTARDYAVTNPAAVLRDRPLTRDGYFKEPWVCEPLLRRADCCLETDAGAAIVVTSLDRSRDCRQRPVRIAAAARAMARQSSLLRNYFRADATDLPDARLAAAELWRQSGMGPRDIDALMIYDMFSPMVLMALEAYGFCPEGEAAKFVADGQIGRGGSLPVNTNGGLLGEGYVHGFNGIAEGVRQLRGSSVNQIKDPSSVVVSGAPPLPTSALILTVEGT